MGILQNLMTAQKHRPHKHRYGKYGSLYAVDWEIFICRIFRLLNFRQVIFSLLSTPTKIQHAEN